MGQASKQALIHGLTSVYEGFFNLNYSSGVFLLHRSHLKHRQRERLPAQGDILILGGQDS